MWNDPAVLAAFVSAVTGLVTAITGLWVAIRGHGKANSALDQIATVNEEINGQPK